MFNNRLDAFTCRRLERKKTWLKTNIIQLCRETEEISRVIKSAQTQLPILHKEYVARREQFEEKLNAGTAIGVFTYC